MIFLLISPLNSEWIKRIAFDFYRISCAFPSFESSIQHAYHFMGKIKKQPYASSSRNARNIIIKNNLTFPLYSNIGQKYSCLSVEIFDAPFGCVKPVKLEKINIYSSWNMSILIFRKRSGIDYDSLFLRIPDSVVKVFRRY